MSITLVANHSRFVKAGLLVLVALLITKFVYTRLDSDGSASTYAIGLISGLALTARLATLGRFSYRLTVLIGFWVLLSFVAIAIPLSISMQVGWWLLTLFVALHLIAKTEKSTPLAFIFALSVLAATAISQLYLSNENSIAAADQLATHLTKATILICALMVTSVTAQVLSPFILRGLSAKLTQRINQAELVLMISAFIATFCFIAGYFFSLLVSPGVLMIGVGCMHTLRQVFWLKRIYHTRQFWPLPLLWLLSFAYLMMAVCLILLGFSYFTPAISFTLVIHLIAISLFSQTYLAIIISVKRNTIGKPTPSYAIAKSLTVASIALTYSFTQGIDTPVYKPFHPYFLTSYHTANASI